MLECSDKSLYCGITTDIQRRLSEHNSSKRGAKYTKSRRPVSLVFTSQEMSRSHAASIEARFKKLHVSKKRQLIHDACLFNAHFSISR